MENDDYDQTRGDDQAIISDFKRLTIDDIVVEKGEDEVIISDFMRLMMNDVGFSWPGHIEKEEDVFKMNSSKLFIHEEPIFVIVKASRDAYYSNSEECEYGFWRIMGGDKLIKSETTGKILGFKKILKFCIDTKPREYKRSWVMEEYRLANKWKQDHVICKIQLMFQTEISFLLDKHFSHLVKKNPLPATNSLPDYGINISNTLDNIGEKYLNKIIEYGGYSWPEEVTNDVYSLHPMTLVDLNDEMFLAKGKFFFANRKLTSGLGNRGRWRIIEDNRLVYTLTRRIKGFIKRVFRFVEKKKRRRYFWNGSETVVIFFMEEYRVAYRRDLEDKVLCVITAHAARIIQ